MSERAAGSDVPVRDAASVILVRRDAAEPKLLMGQRGSAAAFMPDMFVFPGGALDADDLVLPAPTDIDPATARRLALHAPADVAQALPLTAVREVWEETGLRLGRVSADAAARAGEAPAGWRGFFATGAAPRTDGLRFVFRAVTPPGRPRRFDARFFLAEAENLIGDGSDFAGADAELSNLCWIGIREARSLPLPFITTVVLSEIEALLAEPGAVRPAPYFRHDVEGSHFALL